MSSTAGVSRDPRDRHVSEARVQKGVLEVLELFGFSYWRIGQRNATGTQDPGPSDIIAVHVRYRLLLFIEVKRPCGRQSLAQRGFQLAIERAGGTYLLVDDPVQLSETLTSLRRTALGRGA